VGFNLFMTAWLGEIPLLMAGLLLTALFLLASWKILARGGLLQRALARNPAKALP
jgi:hypothetical protein